MTLPPFSLKNAALKPQYIVFLKNAFVKNQLFSKARQGFLFCKMNGDFNVAYTVGEGLCALPKTSKLQTGGDGTPPLRIKHKIYCSGGNLPPEKSFLCGAA